MGLEWIVYAVIMVVSAIVAYEVASKNTPTVSKQQPKRPSINDGDSITVVFGKVIITAPNVSSWGDMEIITREKSSGKK